MDKRRAIQIMTKAAQLYKEHLEDQKVLFLYGLPKEVNKQLQESNKILSSVQGYEVVFHRYNFLHLTGVRLNKKETASAIHFYQKCLDKRLTENDFVSDKHNTTFQCFINRVLYIITSGCNELYSGHVTNTRK